MMLLLISICYFVIKKASVLFIICYHKSQMRYKSVGNIMTSQTSMLHVRIDDETKLQAQQALKAMGLSVSDAVRIFLTRVVAEQAIPFDVRVPNAQTVAAMNEADELIKKKKARFETVEELFNELEQNNEK